ncbi:hypothetical protein [Streptomyces phaeochromogenes]
MTIGTWPWAVRYATLPPKRSTAQRPVLPPVFRSAVGEPGRAGRDRDVPARGPVVDT